MSARKIYRILGVTAAMACALTACVHNDPASAGPCTDVEVVSGRGTGEAPGVGYNGQAFIDDLRPKIPGRSLGVYPVNYPASDDIAKSLAAGADDARAHVQSRVANCPNTRIVLTGHSQGAAVMDLVTQQLPPEAAEHIAAVAVFGNPRGTFARKEMGGSSPPTLNPLYLPKTIDLCVPNDPVCTEGTDWDAHQAYIRLGMVDQAATFVAGKLQ
jgi:cutinase